MNKKMIFFIAAAVILVSTASAQATNGYGQLTWGASIAETLRLYPNLVKDSRGIVDQRSFMTDYSAIGVECYSETNVGNDIDRRLFYFYQGRLFLVREQYNIRNISIATIRSRLEPVYGPFTENPTERLRTRCPLGVNVNITVNGFSKQVNNNLEIEINLIEGSSGLIRRSGIVVDYRNPSVWRQVIAAR